MADIMPDAREPLEPPLDVPDAEDVAAGEANKSQDTSRSDADTCRICRSEGTPEEPLFYPCKCSGSIKHVHQECLMEWLSHTNKKHCELCKTPFRFTKLYDPHMPDNLPMHVFLVRACIHLLGYVLDWLRAALVAVVWLALMPWAIRWAWRSLFYMMDAGWARDAWLARVAQSQNTSSIAALSPGNTTVRDSTVGFPIASLAFGGLTWMLQPWTKLGWRDPKPSPEMELLNATTRAAASTLLTDVASVNNVTGVAAVDRVILDILEGEIITIIAVIAFILVFLIREWVIQQQPILNAAAHVREAQRELDRVEQARQRLRNDIQTVEEELKRLDTASAQLRASQQDLPRAHEATSSAGQEDNDVLQDTSDQPARAGIDWYRVQQSLEDATLRWHDDVETRPSMRALTDEVQEIVLDAQNDRISDIEALGKLIDWAKRIPPDVDAIWLSDLAVVFSHTRSDRHVVRHHTDSVGSSLSGDTSSLFAADNPVTPPSSGGEESSIGRTATQPVQDMDATFQAWDDNDDISLARDRSAEDRLLVATPIQEMGLADADIMAGHSIVADSGDARMGQTGASDRMSDPNENTFQHTHDRTLADYGHPSSSNEQDHPERGRNDGADTVADTADHRSEPARPTTPQSALEDQTEGQTRRPAKGLWASVYDFFWGEIEVVAVYVPIIPVANANEIGDDAPVLELAQDDNAAPGDPHNHNDVALDPDVVAAAAEAGINAEAVEDAEDIEGIMELIGMQGPIGVLAQTAIFFGLLVSVTLWGAVGVPYMFGKLALQILGHPTLYFVVIPLKLVTGIGDLLLDLATLFTGGFLHVAFTIASRALPHLISAKKSTSLTEWLTSIAKASQTATDRAVAHLTDLIPAGSSAIEADSYFLLASMQAHNSLILFKDYCEETADIVSKEFLSLYNSSPVHAASRILSLVQSGAEYLAKDAVADARALANILSGLIKGSPLKLSLQATKSVELDPLLSYWSGTDRALAIMLGYILFAVTSIAFVLRKEPLFSSPPLQKIEKSVSDVLRQAGGVVKVIFIISIEMLVFPLYCGMLLDIALIPLFKGVTIASRMEYAQNKPYMCAFLHWFLGTAYMFNFALFVSMCRRLLRSGVLYFIRDPDDPTFHPVRDVLERSIASQLRKIAFSALVYGLMVILCMGGIIWGVASSSNHVFPLRWSSPDPVLEFPLEFLLYSCASPILFKLLQPSRRLEDIFDRWLRTCARNLRLSHFLFGERRLEEEVEVGPTAADGTKTTRKIGWYAKVPASDQVRVQRNQQVFVRVTETDVNNSESEQDCELHGRANQRFRNVYIPPWFRTRIGLFLVGLWLLCASIGIGFTVVPLLLGRALWAMIVPQRVRVDDIWTISLGMYVLLLSVQLGIKLRQIAKRSSTLSNAAQDSTATQIKAVHDKVYRSLKCLYFYGFALLYFPVMIAVLLHFYFIMPFSTYNGDKASMKSNLTASRLSANPSSVGMLFTQHNATSQTLVANQSSSQWPIGQPRYHPIYILPDWTLGFVISRLFMQAFRSRFVCSVFRQITREGKLNPNARLATKAFVLPSLLFAAVALLMPAAFALVLIKVPGPLALSPNFVKAHETRIYRYAYPVVLVCVTSVWTTVVSRKALVKWRNRIKDEVYLIGERLHNLGERKPPEGSKGVMKKGKEAVVEEQDEPEQQEPIEAVGVAAEVLPEPTLEDAIMT